MFLKKLLAKYAVKTAEITGYTMQKLLALHSISTALLKDDWNESAYNDLENTRIMAEAENHWFEELWILLDEVRCLIEIHYDRDLFYTANLRLKNLHKVFDMSDEDFKSKFEENYINGKIQKVQEQTFECLVKFYDGLYIHADYMTAHMNFMAGLLCSKAMGKIEMLTGSIALKDRMERLFKMAVDYGSIRELDKAMIYYNQAIKLAIEEKDKTYEYIALIRKLSICLSSEHIANHINLDSETMSAIVRLYDMCGDNHPDPYLLGKELVKAEHEKAEKGTKAEIDEAKWRISRLRESMPILHLQLALSRGDWQTARIYANELKEKEMEAYGSCGDFSNSDMMMPMYAMLYNSEARNEVTEQEGYGYEEDPDEPYHINFPAQTFPIDKHRYLIMTARDEVLQHHLLAAKALGEQAKKIALEMYSDYHVAMSLHTIGQSYESAGNDEEALNHYYDVVRMLTEYAHPGSDATLSKCLLYTTLFEIGNLTKNTDPEESIRTLSDAIGLLESKNNDETNFLESCLLARAIAKANAGDVEGKEKDCKEALDLIVREAKKRLPFVDKELRENYWAEVSKQLRLVVAQVDENSSSSLRLDVYNAILMAKGFLLSSEKAEKEAIYSERSLREFIPLHKELEEYEASKLPWGTMTENSAGKYVEHYMKSMRLQMATNGVIEKYYDFMHIRFDSIIHVLKDHDVVLDFYDYPLEDGDQQYVAFVYRKGQDAPVFVKVCKESDLQKVYQKVASNKYDDGTPFHISETYSAAWKYSAQLCTMILNGSLKHIEQSQNNRIYFVPSGSLHKIPVESLIVEDGTEETVSDYYADFSRISHVRTLLNLDDSNLNSAGLFGGLNYGGGNTNESNSRGYRIGMDDAAPTPLSPWGELRQTLPEVRNISFLWNMTKGMNAEILTGLDGTPEKFKELSEKGCSVLHLATHGFFETMNTKVNIPGLQGAYKPMDLTGIVMSNGNEGWLHGNSMHHEGILTATDISKLNLSQTKLVVLSACYTGDGVVRSDGVFGLQRAFKKAGAGCLIMSLWNESDEVGSQFMSVFYSHLLSERIDKSIAFKLAKKEIRRRFPHPLFWANFIMID